MSEQSALFHNLALSYLDTFKKVVIQVFNPKRQFACLMLALSMAIGMVLGTPQTGMAGNTDSESESENGAVVANDDRFVMWSGSSLLYIDVEKNDVVADPYHRTPIVGFRRISKGKDGLRLIDGGLRLKMPESRKKDIVAEYRRQDQETGVYSNWATVVIKVKPTKKIKVTQPRPGRMKLINRNAGVTHCTWGTPTGTKDSPDGQKRIKANSAKIVKIHRKVLFLTCMIGPYSATTYDGVLRNLK